MRASAVQLNSTDDKERNLATAERLVREAAAHGAELVVLPEKWNLLGATDQLAAGAEPLDGPSISLAQALARELGVELVAGSIVEAVTGQAKSSNTSVHIDRDGELRGVYRKIHLFDVEIDGVAYRESESEAAGAEIVVSTLADGVRLGMSVCYDLRFPELYRILAVRGAEVVVAPSAFTLTTTRDHFEVLVRCRAIENQCFLIAANQVGAHPPGHRSGGRSLIVDPWGIVLATAPDCETTIVAELDLDSLRDVRRRLPSLANRRPETYEWAAEGARSATGEAGPQVEQVPRSAGPDAPYRTPV